MLVFLVGYAFESSFLEAHGGWIIDSIGTQASTSASVALLHIKPTLFLLLSSRA